MVFLNSDYLNAKRYDKLESISTTIAWLPNTKTDGSEAALFFPLGSGIENTNRQAQQFFARALELRLSQPDIKQLTSELGITTALNLTPSYLKLSLMSELTDTNWIARLIGALQQPPGIDWSRLEQEVNAETYVLNATPTSKLYTAAVNPQPTELTPWIYQAAFANRSIMVVFSKNKPVLSLPPSSTPAHPSSDSGIRVAPDHLQLTTRELTGSEIWVWPLPEVHSLEDYLSQQLLGQLVTQRLADAPDVRWTQQISNKGGISLLQARPDQVEAVHTHYFAAPLSNAELEAGKQAFVDRWERFTTKEPLDWPAILLMNQLPVSDPSETLARLTDQHKATMTQLWRTIQKSAPRQVVQRPLSKTE